MEFTRNCPMCNQSITYPNIGAFNRAKSQNRTCKKCSYIKSSNSQKKILKYERACPTCGDLLKYKSYHAWWWGNRRGQPCRSCSKIGKTMPEGFSEKISKIVSGKGNPMYGRKHTQETKNVISQNNRGNKAKSGQTVSDESKKKMRSAALRRIDNQGYSISYNPMACEYMDTLKPEYNFRHAMNGGEFRVCGYSVDGYDSDKNVVFEYDESHHFRKDGTLKEKDVKRMNIIKEHLHCTFIRYDERRNILTTY